MRLERPMTSWASPSGWILMTSRRAGSLYVSSVSPDVACSHIRDGHCLIIIVQYPEWVGRRDKRGLPILIFDFTKFDSKMINAYKKASPSIYGMKLDSTSEHAISPDLLRAFVVFDNMTRFVLPLCSGAPGGPDPVHKTLHLVDITGIGIRQVWNLRGYIQDLSRLLSRNYPEILDHVFVSAGKAAILNGTC